MKDFWSFFTFSEPNVTSVFFGTAILCGLSGLIGTFTFLRKRSLIGDVIAHSVLPGIALAFMMSGEKNLVILLMGAVVTGWLSTFLVDVVSKNSKIKVDTATALILSVFFGLGMLLLTHIQSTGNANQSGLDSFIFGNAASMNTADVRLFAVLGVLLLVVYLIMFRAFRVYSFDESFAESIGWPVRAIRLTLSICTVLVVAMGVQAVGAVLMAALLITPAASARFWTYQVRFLALFSAVFGMVSGLVGAGISNIEAGMPTGPWMVVVLTVVVLISALFGTDKGFLLDWNRKRKTSSRIKRENLLKWLYKLSYHPRKDKAHDMPKDTLIKEAEMPWVRLEKQLRKLERRELIQKEKDVYQFTPEGLTEARAIVRKHRLWEMYISKYMRLAPDHVHDDAEGMEHVITPEIEALLLQELEYPVKDPHDSPIPYDD
jgi:manganese/zinc/iron transport system permease protein